MWRLFSESYGGTLDTPYPKLAYLCLVSDAITNTRLSYTEIQT
jgi:hypothetical protein